MRSPGRHRRPAARFATATIATTLALLAVITTGAALANPGPPAERTSHRPAVMHARGQ